MTENALPALYAGYESWKRWHAPFLCSREQAAYFAGETRGLRIVDADVLEIGFGSGSFLVWAQQQGARVAGTEINEAMLAAARARQIETLPADFERVAHDYAGRFDTVVALDVFEHFTIAEILTRLAALEIMLKPGGHLLLRFPNSQSPFGLAPQNGDPTHKSALSRSVFEQLVQGRSMTIARYAHAYRIGGGSLPQMLARALRGASRSLLASILNFVYAQDIPWDPVVVLVLRRT